MRPINALGGSVSFVGVNDRPAQPAAVGGSIQIATMNLLNFFNTFDGLPDNVDNCRNGAGGAPTDCRGADTQAEFDRQVPKTVQAILGTGAEVIGLVEIENDGYAADSALAFLVDRLNAVAGAGTWAFIDADVATRQTNALGTDAIKVALVYQPAKVTPVGTTAVLNNAAFVNGGDSAPRNRATIAQAFMDNATGGIVVVNVNHLKSKGSACNAPDDGDGQGNCAIVRANAATLLAEWLASNPTGLGDADTLILGDLNSYAKEDTITVLKDAGYTNLIESRLGEDAYSYVFDGQWGYLDHALASASLDAQVTGVTEWHINADEPSVLDYNTDFKTAGLIASLYAPDQFRIADHDPVIVGLDLAPPFPFTGFFAPATGPKAEGANAGSAFPVKFSLGGDRGLGILVGGTPVVQQVSCTTGVPFGTATPAASNGGLKYDAAVDQYVFTWKTDKSWAGTCQRITLTLTNGTQTTIRTLTVSFV